MSLPRISALSCGNCFQGINCRLHEKMTSIQVSPPVTFLECLPLLLAQCLHCGHVYFVKRRQHRHRLSCLDQISRNGAAQHRHGHDLLFAACQRFLSWNRRCGFLCLVFYVRLVKWAGVGPLAPSGAGSVVFLSNFSFSGWAGLVLTATGASADWGIEGVFFSTAWDSRTTPSASTCATIVPTATVFTGFVQDFSQPASVRRGQVESRFFGINNRQRLIWLYAVAFGFQPFADLNFRDGFADRRDFYFAWHDQFSFELG